MAIAALTGLADASMKTMKTRPIDGGTLGAAVDSTSAGPSIRPWLTKQVGFQLAHEQFAVTKLLELGIAAEQAGFDLLAFSDHFQPWQANEGHSGQAWSQ
jgi:hypothetical protein